jgi:hypothetical protein
MYQIRRCAELTLAHVTNVLSMLMLLVLVFVPPESSAMTTSLAYTQAFRLSTMRLQIGPVAALQVAYSANIVLGHVTAAPFMEAFEQLWWTFATRELVCHVDSPHTDEVLKV